NQNITYGTVGNSKPWLSSHSRCAWLNHGMSTSEYFRPALMRQSSIVLLPFDMLQVGHAGTMFRNVFGPPILRGIRWSMCMVDASIPAPKYQHAPPDLARIWSLRSEDLPRTTRQS